MRQLFEQIGLEYVGLSTIGQRFLSLLGIIESCHDHNSQTGGGLRFQLQFFETSQAVHARQHHIQQHEIKLV
ncbi:hypothetical protein KR52_14025 [Synechococcus sp. KORDI-52]|nr:hypothetical protein KR52_14025 [Synechococcus sp. KORDI-52]